MSHEKEYALQTAALTKRFPRKTALRDCTIQVPAGRVAALVGANGAGKSTLMGLACGLLKPSSGEILVLGQRPSAAGLTPGLAYVAQHKPLYANYTVDDMVRAGSKLNPGFDAAYARQLLEEAEVSFRARVKTLSGGQSTQVALALALGRRPNLIILDEPLADLDPLARKNATRILMSDVAENGTTVLMSSHVMSDLEEVCDHLVLVSSGNVRLTGDVDDLVESHRLAYGPVTEPLPFAADSIVEHDAMGRQARVTLRDTVAPEPAGWDVSQPTLEELVLSYMRTGSAQGGAR